MKSMKRTYLYTNIETMTGEKGLEIRDTERSEINYRSKPLDNNKISKKLNK